MIKDGKGTIFAASDECRQYIYIQHTAVRIRRKIRGNPPDFNVAFL